MVLPHNDPDPDAIASALGLKALVQHRLGIEVDLVYRGIIGRAENQAMVRYLGYPLRPLVDADLNGTAAIALVDTQPGAGNNVLPPGRPVAIVLDHHFRRKETAGARFDDVRPDVGATSTMVAEYVRAAGIEPDRVLSTALLYGIKTDTMGLSWGAYPGDVASYFFLLPRADLAVLAQIERAQVPAAYFEHLVATVQAARIYDHRVLVSYLGEVSYPGQAAEMADLLLRLQGIVWVICLGVYKDEMMLSVRTLSPQGGAERLLLSMVREQGTAGGHGSIAGGQVPLRECDPAHVASELVARALGVLEVSPDEHPRTLV